MFKMFKVGEIFDIHPTTAYKMRNNELFASDGTTPVLSNSSINNGIGGYCGLAPTERGGMITFSDTTTGADTMFYQPKPFIGYPHVQGMYPYQSDRWNEKCCLYVISCIRKSAGDGWCYAVKFNRALVKKLLIELPVIESSDPHHVYTPSDIDWTYMEDHIRRLEEDHIRRLEEYLKVAGFESTILTPEEQEALRKFRTGVVIFRKYRICDLFEIKNTNSVMKNMITENSGKIPYITASDKNNAVLTYISCNKEWTDEGNCIFIGGKTMVITYQEEDFCSNDSHNLALYLKDRSMRRKRIQLFIISCLKKALSKKYTWGNSISRKKIDTEFVSLPCLPSGAPDYALMEVYIRALEKQAISRLDTMQKEEEKITKKITKG